MTLKSHTALLAAILVTALSGCQMRTPKQQSWMNPAYENYKLGKTTVLAISDSESLCMQYEMLFVNALLPYVPAGSLHASQNFTGKIDRNRLDAVLKTNDVKTIIITSLMNSTQRDQVVNLGYDTTPYDVGYWGYYNHGYSVSLTPNLATVSTYMEYTLETNVYDVESKKLIWSGRKSVFDDRSDMANMKIIISSVIMDLEKRGLIK